MRQTITISLKFEKGYIADPYFPAREQLINIQKVSGMNRAKSEDKRAQSLKDFLQRQGMSQEEYLALERAAKEPWYRNGQDIIIPSHQLYGCLIEACRNASATLRPCDPDNLRHVLDVADLHTGKTTHDGIFQRLVMPKSGTGQPLSNQRAVRENPYIADFTATGTLAYFPEDLRNQGESLEEFLAWAGQRIGVGASRKMGYGRFSVAQWSPLAAAPRRTGTPRAAAP
jgi:hypothetical protein